MATSDYHRVLSSVPGLEVLVSSSIAKLDKDEKFLMMEFLLNGLAEYSLIGRNILTTGSRFKDLISGMFTPPVQEEEDQDDDDLDQ